MEQKRGTTGETVSTSMFYMWRCVICIAHADGMIHEKEVEYLRRIFGNMDRAYGLSDEQKALFEDDLENPKQIRDLIRYINDPYFRSQLIYFGGLMAHVDGDLHPSEEALLKKLHADQLASLDMEQIRAEVHKAVESEMMQHDIKIDEIWSGSPLLRALDALLLHFGIDIRE
jgi:uncharacterized membrane protein YebE (DUF533 family)